MLVCVQIGCVCFDSGFRVTKNSIKGGACTVAAGKFLGRVDRLTHRKGCKFATLEAIPPAEFAGIVCVPACVRTGFAFACAVRIALLELLVIAKAICCRHRETSIQAVESSYSLHDDNGHCNKTKKEKRFKLRGRR